MGSHVGDKEREWNASKVIFLARVLQLREEQQLKGSAKAGLWGRRRAFSKTLQREARQLQEWVGEGKRRGFEAC